MNTAKSPTDPPLTNAANDRCVSHHHACKCREKAFLQALALAQKTMEAHATSADLDEWHCRATGSGFYRAYVEVLQGNRMMSDFMAAAGLGLTGAGVRETMTIDYKPGEEVDAARVSKAMDSMIESSNRECTDFKILSYKVLGVTLIPNAQAVPNGERDAPPTR
jgi:hypothetical protein